MENNREYRGRSQRKNTTKKLTFSYIKKLIRQSIISLLILGLIFSPNVVNGKDTSKIQEWVRLALNYKIDIGRLSDILSDILQKSIPAWRQGDSNEEQKVIDEKAF